MTEMSRSRSIVVHGSHRVLQNDLKWIKLMVDVSIVVQKGLMSTPRGHADEPLPPTTAVFAYKFSPSI